MNIIEIKNTCELLKILKSAKFIGMGTTAVCFKTKDNKVLKLYYESGNKIHLFNRNDINEHINLLNNVSNDTYKGPEEIIILNGKCIGYTYPFVFGKTLKHSKNFSILSELINKYDKLYEDTRLLSDKRFVLKDLHDKNIVVGDLINVIDLDQGEIESSKFRDIFLMNMKTINKALLSSIFNVRENEILKISDSYLMELYHLSMEEPLIIKEMLEVLDKEYLNSKFNPIMLKLKVPYIKEINSYYHYF